MEKTFFIPGEAGQIECLSLPGNAPQRAITAVVCHPHPQHGGTMHNKVVTTLAQALRDVGINTVRFNFRGVGASVGAFDAGVGELRDCLSIAHWVQSQAPEQALLLAGFSFGAGIALRAASALAPIALVTIAPAIREQNELNTPPIRCPWIIIQGENDEIIDPHQVYLWASLRPEQPLLIRMPKTSHFFHGQLTVLKEQIIEALNKYDILNK